MYVSVAFTSATPPHLLSAPTLSDPRCSPAPPCPSRTYSAGVKNLPAIACCWATGRHPPSLPPPTPLTRRGRVPRPEMGPFAPAASDHALLLRRPPPPRRPTAARQMARAGRLSRAPARNASGARQAAGRVRAPPRVATRVGRRTPSGVRRHRVDGGATRARGCTKAAAASTTEGRREGRARGSGMLTNG